MGSEGVMTTGECIPGGWTTDQRSSVQIQRNAHWLWSVLSKMYSISIFFLFTSVESAVVMNEFF